MLMFKDQHNRPLGYVDQNQMIYSTDDQLLGHAVNGKIRDAHERIVGRVEDGGKVYDTRNQLIGYVSNNGEIMNARQQVVGKFDVETIGAFHVAAAGVLTKLIP
ncbi:MAG: 5-fold beta-flower protein [Anaerolineae bacterium]